MAKDDSVVNNDGFEIKYPLTDTCIEALYPHTNLTTGGICMVKRLMESLPQEDLYEMERSWLEFHLQEIQLQNKRMELMKTQAKLIEKATDAYKSKK
ncbi:hypothetical protein L1887_24158 [Cichorium endivia]|nr:hypothetical protein L1887_24158 [Cichorium endivia]